MKKRIFELGTSRTVYVSSFRESHGRLRGFAGVKRLRLDRKPKLNRKKKNRIRISLTSIPLAGKKKQENQEIEKRRNQENLDFLDKTLSIITALILIIAYLNSVTSTELNSGTNTIVFCHYL